MARERDRYSKGLVWQKDTTWGGGTDQGDYPLDLNLYKDGPIVAWVRPERKGGYKVHTIQADIHEVFPTRRHAMRVAKAYAQFEE